MAVIASPILGVVPAKAGTRTPQQNFGENQQLEFVRRYEHHTLPI